MMAGLDHEDIIDAFTYKELCRFRFQFDFNYFHSKLNVNKMSVSLFQDYNKYVY